MFGSAVFVETDRTELRGSHRTSHISHGKQGLKG